MEAGTAAAAVVSQAEEPLRVSGKEEERADQEGSTNAAMANLLVQRTIKLEACRPDRTVPVSVANAASQALWTIAGGPQTDSGTNATDALRKAFAALATLQE